MADSKRYQQPLDLRQILQEAQHRWLRPAEICEIIQNHHRFQLSRVARNLPESGTLLLFNRKEVRYFRKDGYCWRKKKDGKTVKEAHEKLKSGSVDVLHCYYAHGEGNGNFQRRSYWMLDEQFEHIVLVHYREVKGGYRSGISRLVAESQTKSPQTCSAPPFVRANSPVPAVQTSHASTSKTYCNGQAVSSEVEDVKSWDDDLMVSSLVQPSGRSIQQDFSLLQHELLGISELSSKTNNTWVVDSKSGNGNELSQWTETHNSYTFGVDGHDEKPYPELVFGADFVDRKLTEARLHSSAGTVNSEDGLISGKDDQGTSKSSHGVLQMPHEHDFTNQPIPNCSSSHMAVSLTIVNVNKYKDGNANIGELGDLRKLDSFGGWMDREIGQDCNDSLMASDSGKYWNTLDTETENKEVSSLSRHVQLDIDSHGPSISQEQLFSILDFSPEWAYTGFETKVLIIGTFLSHKEQSCVTKWGCMFGEIEVAAEVLTANVLRCQTPLHSPGCVPLYITCANRLACSEVREFEFREKAMVVGSSSKEDIHLQIRLAKFLCLGAEKKWLYCANEECVGCKVKNIIHSMRFASAKDWEQSAVLKDDQINSKDALIQTLLKERLREWLVCKAHVGGKGPHILDCEGQGIIHLAAALGYEWAITLTVAAGVSPNFRDARGRTALHWASYFGREETVIELLRIGASPGAVDDPTSKFPGGQTAADLASSRGHKGIAGYLAEVDLVTQLSALNVRQIVLENTDATKISDKTIEFVAQYDAVADEHCSLKGSVAAVTKSARAAALIQASFRADSLRFRQLAKFEDDISGASVDLVALGSLNKVRNVSHFEDYLHSAAVKIQQKYRRYKRRKDFLKIRSRIVKLQAHVRGYQVRKQYRKVVWSVSIVEKAILRWRRKSTGLRGFRVVKLTEDMAAGADRADEYEYEFLRVSRKQKFDGVEKALSRVRSMVRNSEAREQYMRLITRFGELKVDDGATDGQQLRQSR